MHLRFIERRTEHHPVHELKLTLWGPEDILGTTPLTYGEAVETLVRVIVSNMLTSEWSSDGIATVSIEVE